MRDSEARRTWQEKLDFLQTEEAKAVDPEQKFKIRQNIGEAKARIQELDTQIVGTPDPGPRLIPSPPAFPAPLAPQLSSEQPYDGFHDAFREVVAAQRIREGGAMLHLVFGNIAAVRRMPVVIPINQAFDFMQRGPRSVLASFQGIRVGTRFFFDYIEEGWPVTERPTAAGLGHTKYLPLPQNTQGLPGVLFVVTTRDLSNDQGQYGLYVNTPIEGVELALDKVIGTASDLGLESIAVPLLGAGYANIARTIRDPAHGRLLNQVVTLLSIDKLLEALALQRNLGQMLEP